MPRPLHPLACRIGRAERPAVVAFARERGISVSGLIKNAVRAYIAAAPAVELRWLWQPSQRSAPSLLSPP